MYEYIIALCAGKAEVDRWYGWKEENDEAWRGSDDYREANQVALKVSEGDAVAAAHLMKWAERHGGRNHRKPLGSISQRRRGVS